MTTAIGDDLADALVAACATWIDRGAQVADARAFGRRIHQACEEKLVEIASAAALRLDAKGSHEVAVELANVIGDLHTRFEAKLARLTSGSGQS